MKNRVKVGILKQICYLYSARYWRDESLFQVACGEMDIDKVAAHAKLNVEKLKFESAIKVVDFGISGPLKATWFDLHCAATLSPQGYNVRIEIYWIYVIGNVGPRNLFTEMHV